MFSLEDYYYNLPQRLIAQYPASIRDTSKLMVIDRKTDEFCELFFYDIDMLLNPGDVLVVNNTKVIPARLKGFKETGGRAEVLILDYAGRVKDLDNGIICKCLVKASKPPKPGSIIDFGESLKAIVIDREGEVYNLKFLCTKDFDLILSQTGETPLPPYITSSWPKHKYAYQTVYASEKGAAAAPTAGFHFSEKLLKKIESKGIKVAEITLHVGIGTFFPVRTKDIRDHKIHSEKFIITEKSADLINTAKKEGRKIVAVGTTCVRTLEFAADGSNTLGGTSKVKAGEGMCDLFIYPGYNFKIVDSIITNFHLPCSTLIMLVSAFAGREKILRAYNEAVEKDYRFYSYGDAMFIR